MVHAFRDQRILLGARQLPLRSDTSETRNLREDAVQLRAACSRCGIGLRDFAGLANAGAEFRLYPHCGWGARFESAGKVMSWLYSHWF